MLASERADALRYVWAADDCRQLPQVLRMRQAARERKMAVVARPFGQRIEEGLWFKLLEFRARRCNGAAGCRDELGGWLDCELAGQVRPRVGKAFAHAHKTDRSFRVSSGVWDGVSASRFVGGLVWALYSLV